MKDEIASMGKLEVDTKLHRKPSNLGVVVRIILKWMLYVWIKRGGGDDEPS
jgi:hypothetical protein